MDGLGLRRVYSGHRVPFRIRWGEITEGRVAAGRIIEALDELEDGDAGVAGDEVT
jgi:hypothetical protein